MLDKPIDSLELYPREEPCRRTEQRLSRLIGLDLLRRAAEQARRKRLRLAADVWTIDEILEREG
jgi:hypothetical protein